MVKALLVRVHPAVEERYYGCGLVCPSDLTGLRVLDLGCGAGRDVFVLSQLVGEGGQVVGVDMTPEQLAVARDYHPFHAEQFGFDNVTFCRGILSSWISWAWSRPVLTWWCPTAWSTSPR